MESWFSCIYIKKVPLVAAKHLCYAAQKCMITNMSAAIFFAIKRCFCYQASPRREMPDIFQEPRGETGFGCTAWVITTACIYTPYNKLQCKLRHTYLHKNTPTQNRCKQCHACLLIPVFLSLSHTHSNSKNWDKTYTQYPLKDDIYLN